MGSIGLPPQVVDGTVMASIAPVRAKYEQPAVSPPEAPAVTSFLSQLFLKYGTPAPVKEVKRVVKPPPAKGANITWAEVREHNVPEDAWVVIEKKVYDITAYGRIHPGGDVLYSYAGRDATDAFQAFHKAGAANVILRSLLLGNLVEEVKPPTATFLDDFRALRQELQEQGYLNANPVYYGWKCAELLLLVAASLSLLYSGLASSSSIFMWTSAVLLAVFFTQCGWAQHDFNHNQVFRSRHWNQLAGGVVINLGMGGCSHWWKTKHNQHHATPNALDEEHQPIDPDIDVVPLIAWSHELLEQVDPKSRGLIKVQHILIWPLMTLAYVNWQIQGVIHILQHKGVTQKRRVVELTIIALHFAWVLHAIFANLSLLDALVFFIVSHGLSGFMTALIFIQGHNGKEIYADEKDFATAQVISTRNITPGIFTDWITGGLNYQIEHHLFPTMPRHSFGYVHQRVKALCEKHGLQYDMCSAAKSTAEVYQCLATMAHARDNTD